MKRHRVTHMVTHGGLSPQGQPKRPVRPVRPVKPVMKVLLLHGRGGKGQAFTNRIRNNTLGTKLGMNESLTLPLKSPSPSSINTKQGEEVEGQVEGQVEVVAPDGTVPLEEGGYAWWEFPPGVSRSYEASEWIRSEESIERAAEAARECDLCIGFSQGAMLLAVLIAKGKLSSKCKAAVLGGAGWPKPYASDLEDYRRRGGQPVGGAIHIPRLLHVTSENDAINPREQALEVHKCLGGDVLEHNEGHVLPVQGDASDAMAQWINLQLAAH